MFTGNIYKMKRRIFSLGRNASLFVEFLRARENLSLLVACSGKMFSSLFLVVDFDCLFEVVQSGSLGRFVYMI